MHIIIYMYATFQFSYVMTGFFIISYLTAAGAYHHLHVCYISVQLCCNVILHYFISHCCWCYIITLNLVSIMTLPWASVAPMTGVSVFGTTKRVSYLHKHLTPLFGVTMTPSFLQCILHFKFPKFFIYLSLVLL